MFVIAQPLGSSKNLHPKGTRVERDELSFVKIVFVPAWSGTIEILGRLISNKPKWIGP
jgi:hypothetical protein